MTLVRQYNTIQEAVKAANNLQNDGIANDEFFVLAPKYLFTFFVFHIL
ncbi:hypothetical protein [Mesobacillus foraminis]|nr:hypothetical protein [Mesobacillus foraminis]